MSFIDPQRLTSAERLFLSHALIMCYFTAEAEDGTEEYYYVALPGERIEALHLVLNEPVFALEKVTALGRIVASGAGQPNQEVRSWVERHYNVYAGAFDPEPA